jgi:hypothetical protein
VRHDVAGADGRTVVLMDSVSHAVAGDAGGVLVTASHGGRSAGEIAVGVRPAFVTFNDAGRGKDDAGIAGLRMLDDAGIAAAVCDSMSARIGEADDHWEHGVLSVVNACADRLGIRPGMSVRDAVGHVPATPSP